MRIRINKIIKAKTNGIDWAIFAAYVRAYDLSNVVDDGLEKQVMTKNIEFSFIDSESKNRLKKLSNDFNISKSEIIRRCFKWIETQPNYPKNFIK